MQLQLIDKAHEPKWFTYAIQAVGTDYFKVGHSRDPVRRCDALQCGCPFTLRIRHCAGFSFKSDAITAERYALSLHPSAPGGSEWICGPVTWPWVDVAPPDVQRAATEDLFVLVRQKFECIGSEWNSVAAVAARLCVSKATVRSWVRYGILECVPGTRGRGNHAMVRLPVEAAE